MSQGHAEIGGIPCLIREIYYAPPCPEEVAALFEVALTHHNTSNYALAVQTYMQAQQKWEIELTGEYQPEHGPTGSPLPPEAQLFIRLAVGSVFESAGQDDQALAEYMEAKRLTASLLPADHSINATVNSAIGSVYMHLAQFDLAGDHFLKALDLREQVLGMRHVDTGMVLNNIGVCLHCMDRTADALEMFNKAHEVFRLHFALEHPRLVTVQRNIQKAKNTFLKNSKFVMPPHKPLKVTYLPGAQRSKQMMQGGGPKKAPKKPKGKGGK
eukprot:TRINITY_DN15990_c0_g1_i1.p1 TRINITY_DN15990_c0_g1~~TRINITY_DN15990_c0_g1_i1.p1  ORF type:complete len:270 (+),score=20.32 TRINITY_DN15990_c0_g1_i1:77-886(+)